MLILKRGEKKVWLDANFAEDLFLDGRLLQNTKALGYPTLR